MQIFCSNSVQKKELGYTKNTMFWFSACYITSNMNSNVTHKERVAQRHLILKLDRCLFLLTEVDDL